MAKSFDELQSQMAPERRRRNRERTAAMLLALDLAALR